MDFLYPTVDVNLQVWIQQLIARRHAINEIVDSTQQEIAEQQFATYILTGIDRSHVDHEKQVSVTVMEDALLDSSIPILRRDYDSLLIFSDTIPYDTELLVYPIPRTQDTLTESLHIKVRMTVKPGEEVRPVDPTSSTDLLTLCFFTSSCTYHTLVLSTLGPGPLYLTTTSP